MKKYASKKKGVLILTPFYEPNTGGVETHLKDLAIYLKSIDEYNVYILTYQPLTTKAKGRYYEKNGNITIIRIPWIGFDLFNKLEPYPLLEFLYLTPCLFLFTSFFLFLNANKIDVIHTQGFNAAFITRILGYFFKKRFIASIHAVYGMDKKSITAKMVAWTLKKADKVLTLSKASRKELVYLGIDDKSIDTYTYWVDQEMFKPGNKDDAKRAVNMEGRFVVLFVGRLIPIKGINILLDIADMTKDEIFFLFIGNGSMEYTIRERGRNNNKIIFIGRVENKDLPLYYNAADILCVPSEYEEGFGRVILEALSCGTPVIASNKGGIPEAMDDRVGVLVSPTKDNFLKAILTLYKNREELKKKGSLCRGFASKRFGIYNAEKIVNSY